MSETFIRINNSSPSYINHGTSFNLEYSFPDTVKKVLIYYRQPIKFQNYHKSRRAKPSTLVFWNSHKWIKFIRITKSKSTMNLVANYYFPEVKIYLIKSFLPLRLTKMRIPLKIDFLNAIHPLLILEHTNYNYVAPDLKFPRLNSKILFNRGLSEVQILEQPLTITHSNPKITGLKLELNKKILYDE